jgi:Histidine kinase-, DNA gyrase B-, and HSP90-like ATPase
LPSKEKFIVTQIPPSASAGGGYPPRTDDNETYPPAADDLSARGHRSARRRGPLRRLFGRRDHDDDLDPSLDWAAPQADESDDDPLVPAGVPTYRAQHRSDLADAAIAVPPAAPAAETAAVAPAAEAAPDPKGPADGDLLYQVLGGLALRDLTLVESLLQVVEKLESNEENPGQLELLFRIDHLATRMRRNSENLLVLAGHDPQGRELEPVPLLEVARAAVSEITDYSRAQISPLPDLEVMGVAADDLSHILAELLENATSKSPESAAVVIRAERTGDGTMVISVEDSGIGIPPDQLADLNARLSRAPVVDPTVTRHMGLYVVGRLAQRHGIRIQLRERPYGGLIAHVVTPARLVRTGPNAQPRVARRPATKPQPAVPPNGPRLTAVRSPHPGAPGTPPQRERPAPPPAAAPGRPMTPPAPRFAPADPSMLPRRTPSRGAAAGPPPSTPPLSAPPLSTPLASPQPPAETPGTEAPTARADRIRDDLTDFRLGQNEARAAGRQNGTEAGPA